MQSSLQNLIAIVVWTSLMLQCHPASIQDQQISYSGYVEGTSSKFAVKGDNFTLNDKPFVIMSGSLHYFRVPAEYWRDRLQKLKAAGLNAVSTYVEWSFHEPEERKYNFEGDKDIATFIQTAGEEGLFVLLRVGPYICAERDLGGFPYWLLGKYPNIKLRTTDPDFINETQIWLEILLKKVNPFLNYNGGPIILVQVENEYGSYGSDKKYMEKVRDLIRSNVSPSTVLYTTDGAGWDYYGHGSVEGAVTTIDFGPGGDVVGYFRNFRKNVPKGPLMNSELYPGWLTHWGEQIAHTDSDVVAGTLRVFLAHNFNFNFYVFFGGTNFGYTAGANHDGTFKPDITSYDYDAPLTEAGDPTEKYFAIRKVISEFNSEVDKIPAPTPSPKGKYGPIKATPEVNLLSNDGRSQFGKKYEDVEGDTLPNIERLRQYGGFILYETILKDGDGNLTIDLPRDRVYVYVDKQFQGIIDRTNKNYKINIKSKPNSVLSLLVEPLGRINYGSELHDKKGILSSVIHNKNKLNGKWTVLGYPLESLGNVTTSSEESKNSVMQGPVLYKAYLTLPDGKPLDTFLDTSSWGKGYVWVNGHNLGRYYPIRGPQITLYVPGVWLKPAPAQNLIQILELENSPSSLTMTFIDHPILNRTSYAI